MAIAYEDFGSHFRHPATCVRHPKESREMHFCFDCSSVFCGACRATGHEGVTHLTHRTLSLEYMWTQRNERLSTIRQLINDYVKKHDLLQSALLNLEDEQKAQMNQLNDMIDEFASQLCRQVELMKQKAKDSIAMRAVKIWSTNCAEVCRKAIDKELQKMRGVLAGIDREMRLCDCYELCFLEKNKDLESFASELLEFQKKTFDIPDNSCYELSELRRELKEQTARLQRELNRAKDAFLKGLQDTSPSPFPNPDRQSLLPTVAHSFPKEKLQSPNDQNPVSACGVIPSNDETDCIYFVDGLNSNVKMLDLKTCQCTEVTY